MTGLQDECPEDTIRGVASMAVTIEKVRAVMNMLDDQDLSDDVIQLAIDRAITYIDTFASYSRAGTDMAELAKINYAAYVAYQSYSDRVLNLISGTLQSDGIYTPEGEIIQREVMAKLADMKGNADRSLNWLRMYGPMSNLVRPGFVV